MNTADSNVTDMNIHHITECFSSFSVTFIEDRFCLFRTWSVTLFKNDLDLNDNSDSVSSSPMMNCCGLASLWAYNGLPSSAIHRFISFPLLRRPSFVIIPPWVACWGETFHKLFTTGRSVRSFFSAFALQELWLSKLFFSGLSDAEDDRVEDALATRLIIGLDFAVTFFTWILLCSFRHHFRTNCRTEMADVEQTQKMILFVTCEISLG